MANAINMERTGRRFFRQAAREALGADARATYAQLAIEEEDHLEALEEMFNSYSDPQRWQTYQEILTRNQAHLEEVPVFVTPLAVALRASSAAEALGIAIEHEQLAVDFYSGRAQRVSDPVCRDFLNELATMEREHLRQLQQRLR